MQTQTEKQAQMWTINEGGGYEVDEPGEKTVLMSDPLHIVQPLEASRIDRRELLSCIGLVKSTVH
jgi:hypothetical protein